MATVKDQKAAPQSFTQESRAFVFNWLETPFLEKRGSKNNNLNARLEDILDELQGDNHHGKMKIRAK